MNRDTLTDDPAATPGPWAADRPWLDAELDQTARTADRLQRELLHCQEQLSLASALTQQLASLQDPEEIQRTLLVHYASILAASAVYLDRAGCCARVTGLRGRSVASGASTDDVRAALAEQVEAVRRGSRSFFSEAAAELGGSHVLVAALPRTDAEPGVVIALRAGSDRPFDAGDLLAAESTLMYGTQVLRNAAMVRRLQRSALETVCALVNAIDAKDNYTSDHSERVGALARWVGESLNLTKDELQALEWAGLLHDIGKIGVAERILNKPGRLTDSEYEQMKTHPRIGYDMLRPVARFEPVLEAVLHHHENHDGSGYPEGLRREQIPLDARIIHAVDVFDALTSQRPYRRAYPLDRAVQLLDESAGTVTDPDITGTLVKLLRRLVVERSPEFAFRFGHLLGNLNCL